MSPRLDTLTNPFWPHANHKTTTKNAESSLSSTHVAGNIGGGGGGGGGPRPPGAAGLPPPPQAPLAGDDDPSRHPLWSARRYRSFFNVDTSVSRRAAGQSSQS